MWNSRSETVPQKYGFLNPEIISLHFAKSPNNLLQSSAQKYICLECFKF